MLLFCTRKTGSTKAVERPKDEVAVRTPSESSFQRSYSNSALCTRVRELKYVRAAQFWRTLSSAFRLHRVLLSIHGRLRSRTSARKLLAHPLLERRHILWTSQEIPHQIIGRYRPTRLQHNLAITHRGSARQQIVVVELE